MTPTRISAHLLLWTGFLAAAFVTVRSVEVEADPWSTIFWPAYGAALGLAVIGVVLLRATGRRAGGGQEFHKEEMNEMLAILVRVHGKVRHWSETPEGNRVHEYHRLIDDQLVDDLGRFCDLRESMIRPCGLDRYARVMTEFALAERTINRTWSASADGYVDEVRSCLVLAEGHLRAAQECLQEAIAIAAA